RLPEVMRSLVVVAGRSAKSLRHPVQGDRRQQFVLGETLFHVPVAVAPRAAFFQDPGAQTHRRIVESVGQGLRLWGLQGDVAGLGCEEMHAALVPRLFVRTVERGVKDRRQRRGKGAQRDHEVEVESDQAVGVLCPSWAAMAAPQSPPWAANRW